MKKLFLFMMVAVFATNVSFAAWEGDGGLPNPQRQWTDPVIYNYDEEVTWYYDFSNVDATLLEGATLAIWIWQPATPSWLGEYANGEGLTIADTGAQSILKNEGGGIYSLTMIPTDYFGLTQDEILANPEWGFWHHVRLFDADGICKTNCGNTPIPYPHELLLGVQGLANDGIKEWGALNEIVESTVYPTTINATTPVAFILNNDEVGADLSETTVHTVYGINGWVYKSDYKAYLDSDMKKMSTYFGYDDIYVLNVTFTEDPELMIDGSPNPAPPAFSWETEITDIQYFFPVRDWAADPVLGDQEVEIEAVAPLQPMSIDSPEAQSNKAKVNAYFEGDKLIVSESSFDLYSISGVRIATSKDSSIEASGLPKGVYIVKTANGSAKVIK